MLTAIAILGVIAGGALAIKELSAHDGAPGVRTTSAASTSPCGCLLRDRNLAR
jgi:hypothetical protein